MNNDTKNLDIQIYASYFFILTTLISIFLLYNEKQYVINKKYIINKRKSYYLSYFGRLLALVLVIIFLYVNIDNKNKAKGNSDNLKNLNLQIYASILNVISAIIVFYVIASSSDVLTIADVENPIV